MATQSDENQELMGDFLVEAWEQIELLDREFVALEAQPGDLERVNVIFRVMHTLKGGAGFLGLEMLECVTHYSENILSRLRDNDLAVTKERITILLHAADAVKNILTNLEKHHSQGEPIYNDLMVQLKRAAEAPSDWNNRLNNSPEESAKRKELAELQAQLMQALDMPLPGVQEALEEDPVVVFEAPPRPERSSMPPDEIPALALHDDHPENGGAGASTPGDTRIRVNVDLLDTLMNLVGELVLSRNQILQVASSLQSSALTAACQRINLVTGELQEHIMQTRMQPISTLLNRFPRVVRDLCNTTGKDARFSMEGQDTGLDRTILEAIKDPLTHILRNSIDHGLEAPEERVARGKNARGLIHVKAYHEGGQVNIEISDDGAGIDVNRVRDKAVANRLISALEAERLSDRDALHLLFNPGFSMADRITKLSGRGVGMDVVRTSVEKIGGTVDLLTEKGTGTTVKLRLPLTLAIIPALLVTCGEERYAIPQISLQELVRLEGAEAQALIKKVHGAEVYHLRGELLPLLRLRDVLGLQGQTSDIINIIVVSADGVPFGLIVDGVCDTEEIVVKPLTKELKKLQLYAGATIMGDGRVALILDVGGLARISKLERVTEKTKSVKNAHVSQVDQGSQSLLLFHLGDDERYAIPLTLLSRLEEFPASRVETVQGRLVVQYRGRLLKLLDMAEHLGGRSSGGADLDMHQVLVFTLDGQELGLVVGEILDVIEETVRIETGSQSTGVLGTAILGGKATTVVDLYSMLQSAEPELLRPVIQETTRGQKMLLVDDSTFFSALTSSYLQSAGIRVDICRDRPGMLERIGKEQFDAVIVETGTHGADDILDALSAQHSTYLNRVVATCQRGRSVRHSVPTVEPYGRQELLETLENLDRALAQV